MTEAREKTTHLAELRDKERGHIWSRTRSTYHVSSCTNRAYWMCYGVQGLEREWIRWAILAFV